MIAALILAALGPSCWDVYDAALGHSARATHPAYITYDEKFNIRAGDQNSPYAERGSSEAGIAHVQYRDDGLARVQDQRFGDAPILTQYLDPGPPELGPYGARRSMWIGVPDALPKIASVRANSSVTCSMDVVPYEGRQAYHLTFAGANPNAPHLDELWVDVQTHDIWKTAMEAPADYVYDSTPRVRLAHYEVELSYEGRYLVVQHVTWTAQVRMGAQSMKMDADYRFEGYAFPQSLPDKLFEPST